MSGYVQEIWQTLVTRIKQHSDSCTLDTSTTHTTPAVIHVPGQVKCAASQITLPQAKVNKSINLSCKQVQVRKQPSAFKLHTLYALPILHVGDQLLNEVYESMQSECKDRLEDQNVSMMLDRLCFCHNTRRTELSH